MSTSDYTPYTVDVVFCIDVTASMTPYLDELKKLASNFDKVLEGELNAQRKGIEKLRVRIVWFRDLGESSEDAIGATPFYSLPSQQHLFAEQINSLVASGGGSYPESSLEALWYAMNSDWQHVGRRRRHIIVLATDDSAHPLGKFPFELEQVKFPTPKDMTELEKRWGILGMDEHAVMDKNSRRLVLFAPDKSPWGLLEKWPSVMWLPSAAGSGLSDTEFRQICSIIAQSV
jgi:hypothetical protein